MCGAQIRVPDVPTWPGAVQCALMLAIALTSFCGQLVLGRAYQIEAAAKVAAISNAQARTQGHQWFRGSDFMHAASKGLESVWVSFWSAWCLLPAPWPLPTHVAALVQATAISSQQLPGG